MTGIVVLLHLKLAVMTEIMVVAAVWMQDHKSFLMLDSVKPDL